MRFLDVCANPDAAGHPDHPFPLFLIVQSDYVDIRSTTVIVPLVRGSLADQPVSELMPVLEVLAERFVMLTQQITVLPVASVGPKVASLAAERHRVRRAIDILTGDL